MEILTTTEVLIAEIRELLADLYKVMAIFERDNYMEYIMIPIIGSANFHECEDVTKLERLLIETERYRDKFFMDAPIKDINIDEWNKLIGA